MKMGAWMARAKPFLGVVFLQFGFAGMDVLTKAALNRGMSNYVFVVYRHAVATIVIAPFAVYFDRKVRPKMTLPIFTKIFALSLLEPVIDQNLYFIGMKYTSATFASAMANVLPGITFVLALLLRLERVELKSVRSQAKVVGTLGTVAGAMLMSLLKGPLLWGLPEESSAIGGGVTGDGGMRVKGAGMIVGGCFSWAAFMVLQAVTLETYPAELSLTAWICLLGTLQGAALALFMERADSSVWALAWDTNLLAALYSGVVCSGLAYYIQGVVMKERGPVFVTAFSPLCMVIVAIMGSFILRETVFLGGVIGALLIMAGLYLVVWGKSKESHSSQKESHIPDTKDSQLQTITVQQIGVSLKN